MIHPRPLLSFLLTCCFSLGFSAAFAASTQPLSLAERAQRSGAVCLGTVETLTAYRGEDGLIYTTATLRIDERFKGSAPERIAVTYRGGLLDDEGETVLGMPALKTGEERLFFFSEHVSERLKTVGGPAGAIKVRAAGMRPQGTQEEPAPLRKIRELYPEPADGMELLDFETTQAEAETPETEEGPEAVPASLTAEESLLLPPRRSILPDRGEPIRYLVDIDDLPNGLSQSEAMEALENALAAWEEVSAVRFAFEGITSFGQAASNVDSNDNRLRIQLHDSYGAVGEFVLGIGGHHYIWFSEFKADGGSGGTLDGLGFHRVTRSYVVMNHEESGNATPATFEAALTHEIGHALGLDHSSEDGDEDDPYLREAIMYFTIHGDGRGATLNAWDEDAIALVHPEGETAPYGFERVIRAVSSSEPLENPEVNQVSVRGYHLNEIELTDELLYPTENGGSFDWDGKVLTFTPTPYGEDLPLLDPADGSWYARAYIRFDDGINQSAPVQIRIIQYLHDTHANGLPDSWAEEHFGTATPEEGFSGPHDDPDGDGFTNLQEFLLGTDPLDSRSRFAISSMEDNVLEFPARPFDVYELFESTDLENWHSTGQVVQPTADTGHFSLPSREDKRIFFRVNLVE